VEVAVVGTVFHETTAEPRTAAVPLAHVSLELGHLYMDDFAAGPERLRAHFGRVRPWADAVAAMTAALLPQGRPRISTCFLVDDYFTRYSSPAELVPMVLAEAEGAGLRIDYLARESGCARADGVDLAESVLARLVEAPPPGSNGSRPPVREVGWMCNGERTPAVDALEAMSGVAVWSPPAEVGARRHSVFTDVELWDDRGQRRTWSCAFLAAVWQLARLGLLRHRGDPVMSPVRWPGGFPADWDGLPAVVQLREDAAPFAAYQTCSVLPNRFLDVEHAVRIILGRVQVEPRALEQTLERAAQEGFPLPPEVADRAAYVLYSGS
jgi:hypothetical protein